MSYKILYDPGKEHQFPVPHRKDRIHNWFVAAVLFVGIITLAIQPGVRSVLKELLLPGDPEQTSIAVSNLVEELQDGESVGDALKTFCMEILNEAQSQ